MTVQNQRWWGDPTSPDFAREGMKPFGKTSINRKTGLIFSEKDRFVLETLLYPFRVKFGYQRANSREFKNNLKLIKPMIPQIFDFEEKIIQQKDISKRNFVKSGSFLFLRAQLNDRWKTLSKYGTYLNMIKPLNLD